MTDYRTFVESKLADLDRRRAEIEGERQRLMTALSVLDEADALPGGTPRSVEATTDVSERATISSVPAAIVRHLTSAGRMMTTDEIYQALSHEREVSRELMYSALHRLKKRGIALKVGKVWTLRGRDDRTAVDSGSKESLRSLITGADAPA